MLFKRLRTIMEADEAPIKDKKKTTSKTAKQKKLQKDSSDGVRNEIFDIVTSIDKAFATQTLIYVNKSSIKTSVSENTIKLLGAIHARSGTGKEISKESILAYLQTITIPAIGKKKFDSIDLTLENYETDDLILTVVAKPIEEPEPKPKEPTPAPVETPAPEPTPPATPPATPAV